MVGNVIKPNEEEKNTDFGAVGAVLSTFTNGSGTKPTDIENIFDVIQGNTGTGTSITNHGMPNGEIIIRAKKNARVQLYISSQTSDSALPYSGGLAQFYFNNKLVWERDNITVTGVWQQWGQCFVKVVPNDEIIIKSNYYTGDREFYISIVFDASRYEP